MSNPNLKLHTIDEVETRFFILAKALICPDYWHVFYGFDRPKLLIEKHLEIDLTWRRFLSLKRYKLYKLALSYMKDNDAYFFDDIQNTELWIENNIDLLNKYLDKIPNITHIDWSINEINIYVQAINYAFTTNNDVVIGIRPPKVLNDVERLVIILHELIHININNFILSLDLEESEITAAGEIFVMCVSYKLISDMGNSHAVVVLKEIESNWEKHGLSLSDLQICLEGFSYCSNQIELKAALVKDPLLSLIKKFKSWN